MRRRLLLSAAVLGGLLSIGFDAAAQSDREIVQSLVTRIEPADYDLMTKVMGRRVGRADVVMLFTRGLKYFEKRDYFAADMLLDAGLSTWFEMGWPEDDEIYVRARFYRAISKKRFCFDEEADKCKAVLRHHKTYPQGYIRDATLVYLDLKRSAEFPTNLQAVAKRECLAIVNQLQALCRADTTGIKACNPKSPWRCE